MAWTNLNFAAGEALTSTKMNQLQANFEALANGDSGAPPINGTALQAGSIPRDKFKTDTGSVGTSQEVDNSHYTEVFVLPGGEYGFFPTSHPTATFSSNFISGWAGVMDMYNFSQGHGIADTDVEANRIRINLVTSSSGTFGHTVIQRFLEASPPYVLGSEEMPGFVFLRKTERGQSFYFCKAPPWAYNGPTSIIPQVRDRYGKCYKKVKACREARVALAAGIINPDEFMQEYLRADEELLEITPEYKNSDMHLIPHPFQFDNNIVLLPPDDIILRVFEEEDRISIWNDICNTMDIELKDEVKGLTCPKNVCMRRTNLKKKR